MEHEFTRANVWDHIYSTKYFTAKDGVRGNNVLQFYGPDDKDFLHEWITFCVIILNDGSPHVGISIKKSGDGFDRHEEEKLAKRDAIFKATGVQL